MIEHGKVVKHALSVTQASEKLSISWVALELVQWEYVGIMCKIVHINTRCQPDPQAIGLGWFGDVLRIFGLGNHGEEWGNIGKSSILDD